MAEKNNDQLMKDAQYRKGLGIGFFNATNTAIEIVKKEFEIYEGKHVDVDSDWFKERLSYWRNWMIEEHKTYYATVIANVGNTFNVKETIDALNKTKSKEDLHTLWISLSEDERRNEEVLKAKDLLKKKYEKVR